MLVIAEKTVTEILSAEHKENAVLSPSEVKDVFNVLNIDAIITKASIDEKLFIILGKKARI